MIKITFTLAMLLSATYFFASSDQIKQSIATLESNVGDMEVEMIQLKDGKWKLRSYLDGGRIVKREEVEYFYLENNFIQPIEYDFSMKVILMRKYNASAFFNWDENEVSYIEKKERGTVALEEKVLGPSSAQLQLRLDFRNLNLENIPKNLKYKVFWRGKIKERIFDIQKNPERIETSMGDFLTYKVSRRYEEGENKSQIFWLAPDLDFSVIKIFNDDGRRPITIEMRSFKEID
tara:strand:- start:20029 stop:20730 length:702 start_codon:yes stop_codon:yes gene_type:complete